MENGERRLSGSIAMPIRKKPDILVLTETISALELDDISKDLLFVASYMYGCDKDDDVRYNLNFMLEMNCVFPRGSDNAIIVEKIQKLDKLDFEEVKKHINELINKIDNKEICVFKKEE